MKLSNGSFSLSESLPRSPRARSVSLADLPRGFLFTSSTDNGRIKAIRSVFSRMCLRVSSSTYGNRQVRHTYVSINTGSVVVVVVVIAVNIIVVGYSLSVKSTMRSRGRISLCHASRFATAPCPVQFGLEFNRRDRHSRG